MLRRASLGDGSTLSLDFTTGVLDSRITLTRASSGTYLGADGLVKTASTNVARFEYDTSGNPLGLLIEAAATNLLAHTERLDDAQVSSEQYWVTTYTVTGTTNGTTGPDGVANSATQFTAIGSNGTCIATAAMSTSAQRTFSFWAKQSSGSTNLEYTLNNGSTWVAVTTTSSWKRFVIAATTAAQRVGFRFANNNVYEIGKVQLEAGAGASSYISTGASTATRSADECLMDAANFAIGSWYTAAQGTFYTDVEYTALSGNQSGIQLADNSGGSETNRLSIRRGIAIATRGGTTARQFTPTATARAKSAFAYGTADYRFSQNGATFSATAGDNGAPPSSIDRMRMFAPGATQIYGWLRAIKYWPISQSQSFINALTTL
jgi:hypothetical protein